MQNSGDIAIHAKYNSNVGITALNMYNSKYGLWSDAGSNVNITVTTCDTNNLSLCVFHGSFISAHDIYQFNLNKTNVSAVNTLFPKGIIFY